MFHYLLIFMFTVLIMHLTPGPSMLYCVLTSTQAGRSAAIVAAIGLELGTFFYVLLAGTSLSALITTSPSLYTGLKILGSAYLLYMSYKALPMHNVATTNKFSPPKVGKLIGGFLINITNPSILLFFITLLPQFVPINNNSTLMFFLLGLAFNLSSFIVSLGVIFCSHKIQYRLTHATQLNQVLKYIPGAMFFLIATLPILSMTYNYFTT